MVIFRPSAGTSNKKYGSRKSYGPRTAFAEIMLVYFPVLASKGIHHWTYVLFSSGDFSANGGAWFVFGGFEDPGAASALETWAMNRSVFRPFGSQFLFWICFGLSDLIGKDCHTWLKVQEQGILYVGVSLCLLLPGCHFGCHLWSRSHTSDAHDWLCFLRQLFDTEVQLLFLPGSDPRAAKSPCVYGGGDVMLLFLAGVPFWLGWFQGSQEEGHHFGVPPKGTPISR